MVNVALMFFQMCVDKCPDKFMTLVKAYTNKNDFDYYKNFCKEGVTNTMVSLRL